jgi:Na+-driven multidrug efflux pump
VDEQRGDPVRERPAIAFAAIVLGLFAILMVILAALALLDIAQGRESDLTLEWSAVWLALAAVAAAQVVSLLTISVLLRAHGEQRTATADERSR